MDPAESLQLLSQFAAVRYTNLAFLILLIYDHALTLDLEVSRIWTLPWRLPKFLFLINRYLIPPMLFFDGLTPTMRLEKPTCDFIAKWTSWPTILSIGTVDVILILRVMAIYGHSKAMAGFLVGTFIVSLTAWVTLAFFVLSGTTTLPQSELFTGCLFSAPSYFFAAWIPPVAFESVIIVLTLFRTFKYASVPRALHVLARDSIVYFVIVFLMLIANLFIARFGAGFLGALLIVPCSVVACVAAARMTMNIREFTMSDTVEVTPSAFEMSVIQFRPGDRMSMAQQRQTESSMVYVAV